MRISALLVAVAALAVAAGLAATVPATAAERDHCAGVVEIDGCEYCSYQRGHLGEAAANCDTRQPGYAWITCSVWATAACLEYVV